MTGFPFDPSGFPPIDSSATGASGAHAAGAAGTTVAGAAGAGAAATGAKGVIGQAGWDGLGTGISGGFKKGGAMISANWQNSGKVMKVARVIGTGLGVVVIGKGLADLGKTIGVVVPDVDENGKEKPVGGGTLIKSAAELIGGGAIIYASLMHGGKSKAINGI